MQQGSHATPCDVLWLVSPLNSPSVAGTTTAEMQALLARICFVERVAHFVGDLCVCPTFFRFHCQVRNLQTELA